MDANKETHVSTWRDCEQRLLKIEEENSKSLTGVWFRGVSNARWELKTTLERRTSRPHSVAEYFQLMSRVKPEIETFTGKTWELPEWSEPENDFGRYFRKHPALTFMTHLRHFGFPSPILDWSRSPYVAAYFAFAKVQAVKNVAIYVFSETPNNIKSGNALGPKIISHGGYALKTHERHFRQQSSYTVCVAKEDACQRWNFVSHQNIFSLNCEDQDRLYKITVPSSERLDVLRGLDRYNLNEHSLFGSEESLVETLAFREIDQKFSPKAAEGDPPD
jgi:FRG domain